MTELLGLACVEDSARVQRHDESDVPLHVRLEFTFRNVVAMTVGEGGSLAAGPPHYAGAA
jgi:hypothetical protein